MAIPFPSSPFTGEYFTYGRQTYVWNGFKWIVYISPYGTITESGNTKDSFNQININNTKQFDSFNNRIINFEGVNINVYSGKSNTLVFSAQPQTNSSSTFSGGTISGPTNFTKGLTANTIYATTYQNLPSSTFSGGTVTGPTNFTNGLTSNTISGTTYFNLPLSGLTAGQNIGITGSNGNFTIFYTASTVVSSNLQYFVTGSTPSGVTLNSGDRWFNTTTGEELVLVNDGNSSQWLQICCVGSGGTVNDIYSSPSDERMKNIEGDVTLGDGIKLVNNLEPIKYTWKEGNDKGLKVGYSAQQVSKSGFDHLVNLVSKKGLDETIDKDGFVSPKDTQFSMNYEQVIPYHGVVIKYLLEEIENLKKEIKELKIIVNQIP